ncbi:MAG: sialidase family protein, partial [Bacteroidota bacterium]
MRRNFILTCSFFLSVCVHAQTIYKNVELVSRSGKFSSYDPCEPSIAIDPTNPKKMVAGSILNSVYKSSDGGETWDHEIIKSSHGVYGDPTIVASPTGEFYYLHLGDPENKGWSSSRLLESIVIQQLKTNKFSCSKNCWTDGIAIGTNAPKDQDKQWATTSKDGSEIFVTWTEFDNYESTEPNDHSRILFSKGKRGGTSFSKPIVISDVLGGCLDDDNTAEGAVPAAGLNNEVYVAWAHQENIYFNKSLDGGNTWMPKSKVAMVIPGGWNHDVPGVYRANGMPILLSDLSNSPNRGTLYLCWSD